MRSEGCDKSPHTSKMCTLTMTPCIGQQYDAQHNIILVISMWRKQLGFHQTPNKHYHWPEHVTLSGEWLGLRAEEGRGKPRYRLG